MNDRSTEALLARRALAEKATPGPWIADGYFVSLPRNARPWTAITDVYEQTNVAHIAANSPDVVMADIDEIIQLRAEVERLKEENEAHRVVTANFKRITENLTREIDDDDQEFEAHMASLEAQIDFLAKTCARQSHDAPDEEAINWWRAKAREAAEKKA